MLSRTAENLFWMGRYIERADATARLIEMGRGMAMLPGSNESEEWRSVARATAAPESLTGEGAAAEDVIRHLLLDADNPSSIRSCLVQARANGRAIRTALTQDMWETLNDGWRTLEQATPARLKDDLPRYLDWTRQRAAAFRGAAETSLLRNDGYAFLRLGEYVERADMTLRLLDVKYYVLLPETDVVGGGRDYHQWTSVLRATSALRTYHHVHRDNYTPWGIAEFLVLNRMFPRSVMFSYLGLERYLEDLAAVYGVRRACQNTAAGMVKRLMGFDTGGLFQFGLHEFIVEAVGCTHRLSREIAAAYDF
ncbi:MAG: alpha-E domain-containing protein [Alphaproteobacteria bacterium]|jgi:uncharacterized alpha-E superfamily protein|nr:alpha-E domain-containing protein [Alphaproteobacteria bacterium]